MELDDNHSQQFRNRRDNRGSGGGGGCGGVGDRSGRRSGANEDFQINQKLNNLHGPCHDLPQIDQEEILFSGRNRLYVGNLPNDMTEEQLIDLFEPYGKIAESFINVEKNFAFCKVQHRTNAEQAKRELDGTMYKNRTLRVRFAPNSTAVRVKNLTSFVSNELLYKSFEIFGKVERAIIVVDERGKPTGEGLVEFARKSGAMSAIRYCTEKCYFLTTSLRPCICELFENTDDNDGCPEKTMNKKTQDFFNSRKMGPRFADVGSFEHEYGTRWKQVHELYKQKYEALKKDMELEEEKLEAQMEYARYEHETEMLREKLRFREMSLNVNVGGMIGIGVGGNKQMNDNRNNRQGGDRRHQEFGGGSGNDNKNMASGGGGGGGSGFQHRNNRQDIDNRRQQENSLFMLQAQQMGGIGISLSSGQPNFGQRNFGLSMVSFNFIFLFIIFLFIYF